MEADFSQSSPRLFEQLTELLLAPGNAGHSSFQFHRRQDRTNSPLLESLLDERLVLPALRLHLLRFPPERLDEHSLVRAELKRLTRKLYRLRSDLPPAFLQPPTSVAKLARFDLSRLEPSVAMAVHRGAHYLGSPRPDGLHLGLTHPATANANAPLGAVATLSPFDLSHLCPLLPSDLRPQQTLVLSRLVTARWAPRNVGSRLLAEVVRWLRRQMPEIRGLVTYLDPNAGFRGSLYRAANWVRLGYEKKKRYLFLDGTYVTDRQMIKNFGTARFAQLRDRLGDRIERSRVPLAPLEIFAFFVHPTLRRKALPITEIELEPPPSLVGDADGT